MERFKPVLRARPLAGAAVLAIAAAIAVLGSPLVDAAGVGHAAATGSTGATGSTAVSSDPNDYTCTGHVQHGTSEPGVGGLEVAYTFSCDGPITGYTLETEPHQVQYFDQAPVVTLDGTPSNVDDFSCDGSLPGIQIDCVGSASQPFETISGQFTIPGRSICTEPRIDPILTVSDASAAITGGGAAATATVTQYLSGPFDLGRPRGCASDGYGADTRLGSNPPSVVLKKKRKS